MSLRDVRIGDVRDSGPFTYTVVSRSGTAWYRILEHASGCYVKRGGTVITARRVGQVRRDHLLRRGAQP